MEDEEGKERYKGVQKQVRKGELAVGQKNKDRSTERWKGRQKDRQTDVRMGDRMYRGWMENGWKKGRTARRKEVQREARQDRENDGRGKDKRKSLTGGKNSMEGHTAGWMVRREEGN